MTSPQPDGQVETCNDPADWLHHLFGAAAGLVTVFSAHDGRPTIDWGSTDQLDGLAATALRRAVDSDVWFGVATRKERLDQGRRGGAEDCLDIVGLWADIDIDGPNHKGARNLPPTMDAANQLVNDFPLPPSAMVKSGGGLQPWWLFHDPVPADKDIADLLVAWGSTWAELGRRRGWHVDNVFDIARIMRLPGTWNRKNEPVAVTAKAMWSRRYDPGDFEPFLFDAPPAPEPATTRIPYIGPERPGDAFNAVRRGSDVLHAVGFTPGRRDRNSGEEHWVRPGKEKRDGTSATVYPDGHTTIWSETVPTWWPAVEVRRPYDPFGLYTVIFHDGDFTASSDALAAQGYGMKACADDDLSWAEPQTNITVGDGEEAEDAQDAMEIPSWPEMPPEAFRGVLGELTALLAPHTEADPNGILACLLVYFGAAAGPGPHFRLSGTTHSARLNVLVVGDSARARKGSAEGMARWIMRSADTAITQERRASGLNSGEGLIEAVRDPKWGVDKDGNDVIVEKGVDDKRLLLYEPEFAGRLLTAIKRSGSTISALLRMAWDDGNLQTMSRNPLQATGAHICVIGNATVDELLTQMSPADLAGGLLNRFLFVAVRSTTRLPFGGNLDDLTVERAARPLRQLLERARTRTRIEWGDSCRDTWPGAYDALVDDAPDGPIGHVTARGPVQVQRLALVYALADGAERIEVEHLEAAVAFWSYCRASAELILYGEFSGALTGDADGDRMLRLLVESKRPWASDELRQALGWSGSKVVAVRGRLARLQLVKVLPVQGPAGRPRKVVEAS